MVREWNLQPTEAVQMLPQEYVWPHQRSCVFNVLRWMAELRSALNMCRDCIPCSVRSLFLWLLSCSLLRKTGLLKNHSVHGDFIIEIGKIMAILLLRLMSWLPRSWTKILALPLGQHRSIQDKSCTIRILKLHILRKLCTTPIPSLDILHRCSCFDLSLWCHCTRHFYGLFTETLSCAGPGPTATTNHATCPDGQSSWSHITGVKNYREGVYRGEVVRKISQVTSFL